MLLITNYDKISKIILSFFYFKMTISQKPENGEDIEKIKINFWFENKDFWSELPKEVTSSVLWFRDLFSSKFFKVLNHKKAKETYDLNQIKISKKTPEEIYEEEKRIKFIDKLFFLEKENIWFELSEKQKSDFKEIFRNLQVDNIVINKMFYYYVQILIYNPKFYLNCIKNPDLDFFDKYFRLISQEKTQKICLTIKEEHLEKFIQNFDILSYNPKEIIKLSNLYVDFIDIDIKKYSFLEKLIKWKNKDTPNDEILSLIRYIIEKWIDLELLEKLNKYYFRNFHNKQKSFSWNFEFGNIYRTIFDWNSSKIQIENKIIKFLWGNFSEKDEKSFLVNHFKSYIFDEEEFNAELDLNLIKKSNSKSKSEAYNIWLSNYREQIEIIAEVIPNFRNYIRNYKYEKLESEEILEKILEEKIKNSFKKLSILQRENLIFWMKKYIDRFKIVRKYINSKKYGNNKKLLLKDWFWIDISKLKWDIDIRVHWANFICYIDNIDDYKWIYYRNFDPIFLKTKKITSSWFISSSSEIKGLENTFSFLNKLSKIDFDETISHESTHSDNSIIFPEFIDEKEDNLVNAKDEIIAYLKWWETLDKIKEFLIWYYDYYKDLKEEDTEKYLEVKKIYEKQLNEALEIALYMKWRNVHNFENILSVTPIRKWWLLKKMYK